MALYCHTFLSPSTPSLSLHIHQRPSHLLPRRVSYPNASLSSSSSPESKASSSPQSVPSSTTTTTTPSSSTPFVESRPPEPPFNYALANPNGNPILRMVRNTESSIERVFWSYHFFNC